MVMSQWSTTKTALPSSFRKKDEINHCTRRACTQMITSRSLKEEWLCPQKVWERQRSPRCHVYHPLTDSGVRCPALCLRGGRGLTWVTWRKGEPLVGRVDRHSHDAEWVRGAECGGAEGVGEGLASSPRPRARQDRVENNSSSCHLTVRPAWARFWDPLWSPLHGLKLQSRIMKSSYS